MTREDIAERLRTVAKWVRFAGPLETSADEFASVADTIEGLASELRQLDTRYGVVRYPLPYIGETMAVWPENDKR